MLEQARDRRVCRIENGVKVTHEHVVSNRVRRPRNNWAARPLRMRRRAENRKLDAWPGHFLVCLALNRSLACARSSNTRR